MVGDDKASAITNWGQDPWDSRAQEPFGKSPGASQARICAAWMHKQPGIALWPERFGQGQRGPAAFRLCNLVAQGPRDTEEELERGSREGTRLGAKPKRGRFVSANCEPWWRN